MTASRANRVSSWGDDAFDGTDGQLVVPDVTLLELVTVVRMCVQSEAELLATVVYMVNGGSVRLCSNFKGARFDLSDGSTSTSNTVIAIRFVELEE